MAVAEVVFFLHSDRPAARKLAEASANRLAEGGHLVRVLQAGVVERADLVVSLGGDGTMLRAIAASARSGAPILGVNLGRLGYLTEAEPEGLDQALDAFFAGDVELEERMTLEVELRRSSQSLTGPVVQAGERFLALNEAVIEKAESGHLVRIGLDISGRRFLDYAADGLIVATPTGSTAYNLSARGPIVSPRLHALVVTPVSPHMVFDRALVLEATEPVEAELLPEREAVLVVDGTCVSRLAPGDRVAATAGKSPVRLVRLAQRDFHAIVRAKFGLGEGPGARL